MRARHIRPLGHPVRRALCGASLVETVVVLALLAILVQLAAPSFVRWRLRTELRGAVQNLRLTVQRLRSSALATGRTHGVVFAPEGELSWETVVDGDGDGVRSADLAAGIDIRIGPTWLLDRRFPGLRAGLPQGVPTLAGGAAGRNGVAFGRSSILSCSPDGTTSTGTLYLHDPGGNAAALRLYGPTGRVTLWWWNFADTSWKRLD